MNIFYIKDNFRAMVSTDAEMINVTERTVKDTIYISSDIGKTWTRIDKCMKTVPYRILRDITATLNQLHQDAANAATISADMMVVKEPENICADTMKTPPA